MSVDHSVARPGDLYAVSQPVPDGAAPTLLGDGPAAFATILDRIAGAQRQVVIRAFLWRDDAIGNQLAAALLAAAERGVQVTIYKDRIAAVYEYTGGNKQSFFHKKIDPVRGFQAWFLSRVYRAPGSMRQRPNSLERAVNNHRNIAVRQAKRFDHSKVFVIDDAVILGSMGIGDNHHLDWIDMMVELRGAAVAHRLADRLAGRAAFEPARGLDFILHSQGTERARHCAMVHERLAILESARHSIVVEMAYLGDRRFTDALLAAVRRGVAVTLVTAARADVLGNLNHAVCNLLLRHGSLDGKVRVVLHPRMVHSKVVVVDERFVDLGSANFTPLSHGVYDEVNVFVDSREFAATVLAEIERHAAQGQDVTMIRHRAMASGIERVIMAYQARRGS
ncbi:MAG: phosphatidylserine/phosphatidylglycerophosphate/cardiolipin synthase family protein [Myxococcales bacterium]|nr:phosphatidylserine/phosphatidylglycerophosphate/cardiolipin synthase family protein [Myxococcales bacterium]